VSNQRNITAAYTYNTRNLPANVSYSDGTPTVVYSYDAYGARSSVTDGEGQTSYTYNSYRQLQSEQRTFTGLANRFHTLNYAYNLADQVRQVNYQVTEQTGFVPVAKDPVQIAQQIQPEPMPQVSRPGQTAQPEQPARTTAKRRTAQAMMSNRSITGIVRHAATNQGIGAATVTANRLDDPQAGPNPSVQTSSNSQSLGSFLVEDLPDGATYRLTVSKNGYVFSPSEVTFEMTEDKQQDFTGLEYPPTGTLSASPNPIQVCDSSGQGAPTLTWSATGVTAVQIRRGAPDGPLVGSGGTSGSAIASQTTNGTVFYLQNVTGGLPLTSANTLTTATVTITQQGCPVFTGVFNKTINFAYNSVGALASVGTDLIAGASDTNSTNVLNTLSFRSSGALSSVNYGNGRRLQMGYNDDRSQPISMKVDRVTNSADKIIDYQYNYYDAQGNNNNRIRKITDNIDPQYTTTYSYDGYNRLKEANWSGDGRFYQYDEWGNIKSVNFGLTYNYATSGNGAPATNRLESVALDGVTQTSYSYDAAGNTVSGDGKTFAYDAVNRLKSVNSGASTYGYDGDGKRVRVTDGSAAVFYVYSSALGQSVMEVTSAGVQRAYVYSGGKVVAMQATDGQFYWLHQNHLGSSRAMTDVNGNLAYKGQFDPYGQVLNEWASSGNNNLNSKKFTGYERDIATGLDYAQARMYNPVRGRFMQPDPLGLEAADASPQSLNRYAYVSNDPINFSDPSGLIKCGDIGVDVGGTLSQHVNVDNDRGKLIRYVWEEAGNLQQHGGNTDNLRTSQLYIAQAMMNRLDLANGRVAVLGKDGVVYWGNGEDGNPQLRPVTQLGVGGAGTTMSQAIVRADGGVGAVDITTGELSPAFRNQLNGALNNDEGDVTLNGPGRFAIGGVNGSTLYVSGECYRVITAMQGTNSIYYRLLTVNQPGFFVTNWKGQNGTSSPDPGRLFDFPKVGPNSFWGFQLYQYAQYTYPVSPSRTISPPRAPINRGPR